MENNKHFVPDEVLNFHKKRLADSVCLQTYQRAIFENHSLFYDSVVLDVGAGTGILSIFAAQAGAKRVYAVEDESSVIPILINIVAENNCSETITVIEGDIEQIALPEQVDIIISEWMGDGALHKGLLESVIKAKKFLKEGGSIFPDECKIFLAICDIPSSYHEMQNDYYGIKMTSFSGALRSVDKLHFFHIDKKYLRSKPAEVYSFKISETEPDQLAQISINFIVNCEQDVKYEGICQWFSVTFDSPIEPIVLSTSPYDKKTKWEQTIILLSDEEKSEIGDPSYYEIFFKRKAPEFYGIEFQFFPPTGFVHPVPCHCNNIVCCLIKAFKT